MTTYSATQSSTFTITNARYLSSKVAADMHLCAQYYGQPTESKIRDYAEELAHFIKEGYVLEYEFGYKKNGQRVVTWRYKVDSAGRLTTDDRPGKVVPYVDITGAAFFNFLAWNSTYANLPAAERDRFKARLPIQRTPGSPPTDGLGYWTGDRNYYSGGQGLGRRTFQPLQ